MKTCLKMDRRHQYMREKIKCDLYCRFSLGNQDLVVRGNCKKLFDQLRNAHWFYLDFYCPQPGESNNASDNASEIPIAFEDFCDEMILFSPEWKHLHENWRQLYGEWRHQTSRASRCGAIILDHTYSYVLLVRGFFRDGFQFPAGKKDNDGEPYETCAVREVKEETGFDISKLIRPSLFLEREIFSCLRRYYLIPGVHSEKTFLCPSSRNEIKVILWMKIDNIPEDNESARKMGHVPRDFFLCMPWAKQLKTFSRYLREGSGFFQALHLAENISDHDSGDNTSQQQAVANIKAKPSRHTRHQKVQSSSSETGNDKARDNQLDVGKSSKRIHSNNVSEDNVSKADNSAVSPLVNEKNKVRRRCERRKCRNGNANANGISEANSDACVDSKTRRKGNNKTKDISFSKNHLSPSSDSGYSDHSDQTSSFSDHGKEIKEFSSDLDLMDRAVLALKQISVTTEK